MVTRKPPYRAFLERFTSDPGRCVASLMTVTLLTATVIGYEQSSTPLTSTSGNAIFASFSQGQRLPSLMSRGDEELYRSIFHAQKKGDWTEADQAIRKLGNKLLLGHVLAERYLDRRFDAQTAQLADWLKHYSDLPQAEAIQALPAARTLARNTTARRAFMSGYGDDSGPPFRADDARANVWRAGIDAWKNGRKADAARLFSSLAQSSDTLAPWTASAVHYWAYRSYSAVGNKPAAERYLRLAATQPRSFYGILARRQLHQKLDLDTRPLDLADSDILEIVGEEPIRRTIALTQVGAYEMADKELRAYFPQAPAEEKPRLLALACELKLASVQIGMAKQLSRDGRTLDFARYPVPRWQPDGGFKVDPALIFALTRQESGFRASAVSPGGALGLMQLMPQTASMMHKSMNNAEPLAVASMTEPVTNVTLGQTYVRHLLDNNLVNDNLFYLLTAYNAGPGRLQDWKQSIGHNDDPLLFVESIPYAQTRSYVMQVMTSYWIYSEMAGRPSNTIYALLKGRWPSYDEASFAAIGKSDKDS